MTFCQEMPFAHFYLKEIIAYCFLKITVSQTKKLFVPTTIFRASGIHKYPRLFLIHLYYDQVPIILLPMDFYSLLIKHKHPSKKSLVIMPTFTAKYR